VLEDTDLFVSAKDVRSVLSFHASAAASPMSAIADETETETRQRCLPRQGQYDKPCQMLCVTVSSC
jgi:hypothetical protein